MPVWGYKASPDIFTVGYFPYENHGIIKDNKLIIDYSDIFNVKISVGNDDKNCSFCMDYLKTPDVNLKSWRIDSTSSISSIDHDNSESKILMVVDDRSQQLVETIPFLHIHKIPNAYQELIKLLQETELMKSTEISETND